MISSTADMPTNQCL